MQAGEGVGAGVAGGRVGGRGQGGGEVAQQASPAPGRGGGRAGGRGRGRGGGRVVGRGRGGDEVPPARKLTAQQWAAFWLHDRPAPHNNCMVTHGGRLFQEWAVDQYSKVESQRLEFIRHHQQELRVDLYQGVADALLHDNIQDVGRMVVLPATFIGGGPPHASVVSGRNGIGA